LENPFESGHIKNYILLYSSVVVIMVLFFIATSLFHNVENVEKKHFDSNSSKKVVVNKIKKVETTEKKDSNFGIILMDK